MRVLGAIQSLGALLLVVGAMVVSIRDASLKLNKGDILALLAALTFGIANTNDRFLVKHFDPYTYAIIGFFLPGLLISVCYPKKMLGLRKYVEANFLYKILLLCFLYGASAVTFFAALQVAPNSSQIFTINAFGVVVTVGLSMLFLGERDGWVKKVIGTLMSLIGLLFVNK